MSAEPITPATPSRPPILHGRYRIEESLGVGRLAVVYRAYDERLQRQVLIHLFRRDLVGQEPLRLRFLAEAQHSASRSHASLLDVFDTGEVGGRPFMVTEFVAGRTLREIGALSLEEALLYFRQLVGAVAACQAAGVPHPPISSANVILVNDGHVELLENWATPPAERGIDLASYRPPERTAGEQVGPAGAVYSLGLLLIEMLSGRRVFAGDDPRAVAARHLNDDVPPLATIQPRLFAPSLDALVRRATARDPQRRPQDAAALGQALDELRRAYTGETQRLAAPPARPARARDRITSTLKREPKPPARPVADPIAPLPAPQPARQRQPAQRRTARSQGSVLRQPLVGLGVVVMLFLAVACGAYAVSSAAAGQISAGLPSISLPDWITGVVGGEGEVLVVTIGGVEGLNLRADPGLQSQVIALLPNGARVRKLGGPRQVDNVAWLRVRAEVNGRTVEGWAAASFLSSEG
jgi:eukaryotic-like serine/threonine-protein kinase